jgi:hypothetical protein
MRAKLGKAPPVDKANPLGETLELLLGAAAAALTAWQQAVVAAVFELCLVGVMVIYELLGQAAGGRVANQANGAASVRHDLPKLRVLHDTLHFTLHISPELPAHCMPHRTCAALGSRICPTD